jgi:restriction system protein
MEKPLERAAFSLHLLHLAAFQEHPTRARRWKPSTGQGKTMELTEYPLLHEVDLMLTLLKVAIEGPASIEDAAGQLKRNLHSVGEAPPVSDAELQTYLARARDRLFQAVLLTPFDDGRFAITPRGKQALSDHPDGIDDSVLMNFPEFRAFIEAEAGRPVKRIGSNNNDNDNKGGDDPRIVEFDQGYAAFHEGLSLQANPYEQDRVMHLAWENGWCEARDDALRTEKWADRSTNI